MSTIVLTVEKRKLDNVALNASEPPSKKVYTDGDVLDLSGKSDAPEKCVQKKFDDDVILLSEDEDEAMLDAICSEMEKENAPDSVLHAKSKALLAKIENELRNEESTLLLLQQLRANQRAHSTQLKSSKSTTAQNASKSQGQTHSNSTHYHVTASDRATNSPSPARPPQSVSSVRPTQASSQGLPQQSSGATHSFPKVTKVMAIQALEQQCNGKKAVLQKHLERTLDKVALPRPSSGAGPSDVAFVPSTLTNEFTALVGLEEIVHSIQDYEPSCGGNKSEDPPRPCTPFACANCGTDFTPVWKRKRSGSSDVVCEACIIDGLRSGIHKTYNNVVSAALKQYATSERELEHEYQEIVNSPAKLEAFIKDHERKLLASQPQVTAPQQQSQPQPSTSVNPPQNQRYHHQQQNFQSQSAYANVVGARHTQSTTVNSNVIGATAAAHLSLPVANARRQTVSSATLVTSASAPSLSIAQQQQQQQQQSQVVASNVVQQFASQYQQLTKAAAQAGHATNSTNVAANLMMAAAAANPMLVAAAASASAQQQQQQQQQAAAAAAAAVQQRLVAAAALSGFQHQQQQQQQSTLDQYARLQDLLMNSILCNAATAGTQNTAIRQPQQVLQQALLQYACLLQQQQQQQQQQQAATQAQQQQQANAAALQQLMTSSVGNPAACMALLQSWWALNAAAGAGNKK